MVAGTKRLKHPHREISARVFQQRQRFCEVTLEMWWQLAAGRFVKANTLCIISSESAENNPIQVFVPRLTNMGPFLLSHVRGVWVSLQLGREMFLKDQEI